MKLAVEMGRPYLSTEAAKLLLLDVREQYKNAVPDEDLAHLHEIITVLMGLPHVALVYFSVEGGKLKMAGRIWHQEDMGADANTFVVVETMKRWNPKADFGDLSDHSDLRQSKDAQEYQADNTLITALMDLWNLQDSDTSTINTNFLRLT